MRPTDLALDLTLGNTDAHPTAEHPLQPSLLLLVRKHLGSMPATAIPRTFLIFCALLFGGHVRGAELPPYLKEAISHFHPTIPADWAYTITTRRGDETAVERYDPSLPFERQWTLLQRNNRPATTEENSRYGSYRISTSLSTSATFRRGDIDLNTIQLVREDHREAEFQVRFREDLDDQMLRMLELHLTVGKQPACVAKFMFRLTEPYSPVLTVKMLELQVETNLTPRTEDRPALPLSSTSRFRGRIFFFKDITEDTQTTYSKFQRVVPFSSRPSPPAP